ncbi:leupaxin-like isoform X1 [Salvelinus namaycush]|uniref:Leupaxin-like isoform X1 n=1 Tax=Salvelinus namaycush TaxID=8040 RepID=A0A8U0R5A3_SALNM|nr:leupaxin-like isoform X1 [Salvelinus namaycush]
MDELDLILEELAFNLAGPESATQKKESDTANTYGQVSKVCPVGLPPKKENETDSTNVYSELPAPVDAGLLSPCSATRELDSIMEDLLFGLEMGLPDPPPPSTPPPLVQKSVKKNQVGEKKEKEDTQVKQESTNSPKTYDLECKASTQRKTDAIDDLLGGLSSDMEKMGVRTVAKGHCASCGKVIVGKMITALGQVWHPEHFVCVECQAELGTSGFFEREGKAYCEKDYQHLFSPRCGYCKGPILQNILTAMDRTWHPEHFFCSHCGELFGAEGFLEKDGKPYCHRDFYHLFAPKCTGCGDPVRENYLTAANGTWHPNCFVCSDCLKPFNDGCFLELDGRPLCSLHFHSRQGTLCGGCGEPISGRCISALERKFHPEHFVCAFCLRKLSQGVFKEQAGKPYCSACHTKLFV